MLEDIMAERERKLARLRQAGIDPYPSRVRRSHTIGEVLKSFSSLSRSRQKVSLVGRVMSLRDQGGIIFLGLEDESGKIQVVLKKDDIKNFSFFREVLDRGDFISVAGVLFITRRGEKSIAAQKVTFLAKTLRPLPSTWYGLEETETRLRRRYLDFILNPDGREMFRKKSVFWEGVREFLKKNGFLEVELPVLEAVPGGAEAEPFKTHLNALDTDFYLRISLELPLKKLLVGGYEKVFEIGRVFRNEGIDREHLQDYTQMEFYWAYHDYRELMSFTHKLFQHVIKKTIGQLVTTFGGRRVDWRGKWPQIDYCAAFRQANGLDPLTASLSDLRRRAERLGAAPEKNAGRGRLIDLIYKKSVRPTLFQPCFLIHHPKIVSPLAKSHPANPEITERFQIVACGTELGNGFSELNDPLDQRERFEEQMRRRAAGDKEAMMMDEEFLIALEYGMPPAAGFGTSERLFSVLMDKPVRETVFFPLMRPRN